MILHHASLRLVSLMLLAGWMLCIFLFSSQTASDSAARSHTISIYIATILLTHNCININSDKISNFQRRKILIFAETIHSKVRKSAHLFEYFILGILLIFYCNIWYNSNFSIVSFCFGLLYASSDEIHQFFISGRACQISDIFLDSIGVLLGIALSIFFQKICRIRSMPLLVCSYCQILLGQWLT